MLLFQFYILHCSCNFLGLLRNKFSPLDIATATIKDNRELALALEESHLETVVQLLVSVTINTGSQVTSPVNTTHSSSPPKQVFNTIDWNPVGGDKCMEFLQTVVWVDSESFIHLFFFAIFLL